MSSKEEAPPGSGGATFSCRGSTSVLWAHRYQPSAKVARDIGLDDHGREALRRVAGDRVGMDAEERAVSCAAEKRFLPINGTGREARPEAPACADAEEPLYLDPYRHACGVDLERSGLTPERGRARLGLGRPSQHITWRIVMGQDARRAAVQLLGQQVSLFMESLGAFDTRRQHGGVVPRDQVAIVGNGGFHRAGQVRGFPRNHPLAVLGLGICQQRVEPELGCVCVLGHAASPASLAVLPWNRAAPATRLRARVQ